MTDDISDSVRNGARGIAHGIVQVQECALCIPDAPADVEILHIIEAGEVCPLRLFASRVGVELIACRRRVRRHLRVPAIGKSGEA